MFKSTRTLISRCSSVIEQSEHLQNAPQLQFVRWRMRRWAPKNPSKIFYVRKPTPIDPEEEVELRERYAHYRTTMKAIRNMILTEYQAQKVKDDSPKNVEEENRMFDLILQENDKWNAETAKIREARQEKEDREIREEVLKAVMELEEKKAIEKEANRAMVLREKAEAKNFITLENLEEEIEKALNTRVNYNFAIDIEGNKHVELPDGSVEKAQNEKERTQSQSTQVN